MATHNGGTTIGSISMTEMVSLALKSYSPRALPAGTPITTEIAAVANEAIMLAIRDLVLSGEELDEATISAVRVDMKYFEKAMENVQPMSDTELMKYERLSPNAMCR